MKKQLLLILLLISINSIGKAQILFQKTYNAGADDVAACVQQTNDGGYVIAGYTTSGISGSNKDVLLMKTDNNGNVTWNKTYGGTPDEVATWVQQTIDNGYIICGFTNVSGNGIGFLIKTNQIGDTIWTKTYSLYSTFNYVEQTTDGGYVVCGNINNLGFLLKVDNLGNTLWGTSIGQSAGSQSGFNIVHQTTDGGYIAAGYATLAIGIASQPYLLKLNSAGDTIWSATYQPYIGSNNSSINSVIQTKDLGYIFASTNSTIVKTDNTGNIVWVQRYNTANNATHIKQLTNGEYIATLAGGSNQNIYVLKMDTTGGFKWSKSYQVSTDIDMPGNIELTNDNGFIITGANQDNTLDVYLIKTDSNGVSNCNETPILMSASNPSYSLISYVAETYPVNTSIGYFSGVVNSLSYTATTLCDTNTATGIEEIQNGNSLFVFPNPTNGQFTIMLPTDNCGIIVTDIVGQEIIKSEATQRVMNLQLQQNGVYIIYVSGKDGTYTSKLIVNH
jgi:hypothetical protein